jgi:hypothetical protein
MHRTYTRLSEEGSRARVLARPRRWQENAFFGVEISLLPSLGRYIWHSILGFVLPIFKGYEDVFRVVSTKILG